jgi:hypothetical protein
MRSRLEFDSAQTTKETVCCFNIYSFVDASIPPLDRLKPSSIANMAEHSRPGPVRHLSIESATTSTSPGFSLLKRQSSKSSFFSHPPTPTSGGNASSLTRPWPTAMTMGHLRGMDRPGDRALAYAAAIKGLMEADSGLREWQTGAINRKSKYLVLQVQTQ